MGDTDESVPRTGEAPRQGDVRAAAVNPQVAPDHQTPDPFWARIRRHKVVEWTLAYVAFGYALLHGVQMLRETFDWPFLVPRLTVFGLVLGAPIAVTLAWYHGHRARHRVSGQELSILIALLVVAGSVLWWVSRNSHERAAVPAVATNTAAPPAAVFNPPPHSIAVLPFLDMSERHDQEYFADGMAEEILDILAKVPRLTVIGRTSSFQFKNPTEDLRAIGEKLNSAYVVEGSVRKAGERIRVTAQLIDTHSGTHLWSEGYDRDFGDVLNLQDEIATSIARALQLTVVAHDARPLRSAQAIEAYTLYLKGKLALDKFEAKSLLDAQNSFQQALALDPTLVPAAEGLALTYLNRGTAGVDVPPHEAWDLAKRAAETALQMNANSSIAHNVLGFVAGVSDYDWSTAESELRKGLELNSNDPDTLTNAGQISALHGDDATALQRLNAALTVDPLNATAYQALGVVLYLKGDYSGTESALRKSISIDSQIDGSHYWIGLMELDRSGPNEALREFGAEVDIAARDSGIALAKHALGQKAESDTALAHLMSEAGNTWPTLIVRACAYRGERDRAFDWLEKAYAVRDVDLLNAAREPLLVPLHDDPRWSALMKSMNLAESIGHAPQSPAQ